MGTSRSAAEFSRKITKLATATQKRQRLSVEAGALTAKEIMLAEAAAAGVSPGSRIAGGKWGVGYDVKGFSNPTAIIRYRGAFHLVDNPTRAHKIGPRRGRRGAGKRAVSLGPGRVYRSVQHPGTAGKKTFPAAKRKAQLAVPKVMARPIISGWREALR